MKNSALGSTRRLLATAAVIGLPAAQAMAADRAGQPGGDTTYIRVTPAGDLATSTTPIPGPLHSNISVGVQTSDYFRGRFDGVSEDIDEVNGRVGLSTTLQPVDRPAGGSGLTALSITGGTDNGLTNGPAANRGDWHESNNYAGVAARFGGGWTTGATYTYYAAPDIAGADPLQEVAVAAGYAGDNLLGQVAPQIKLAKPVDESDGWYTEASIRPALPVADRKAGPVTVSFPMAVGVGLDDYYGGTRGDTGVYGSIGAHVSVPLGLPQSFGAWAATAGVDTIVRDNTIRSAGGALDDGGDVIVSGTLGMAVSF